MRLLAQRFGIPLPERRAAASAGRQREREALLKMHEVAAA